MNQSTLSATPKRPALPAVLEVLHPITWFPPMWAFACGVVSSGAPILDQLLVVFAGILLAGPLMCGTSQVVNDWYDRHVDAINEPDRPIPSGRIPGNWGFYLSLIWTAASLLLAYALGPWVFGASLVGMALAWAYSAPPFRLKGNGWWGNLAVGISYEGLAWVTGAAVMIGGAMPDWQILVLALLYSIGAHGIMTLNDFKAIEGDIKMNVRTLPVQLGVDRAAQLACVVMGLPQAIVIALLFSWDKPAHAIAVGVVLLIQVGLMIRFLGDPRARATWFSGLGVSVYVTGMMISAFAVRALAG
ncbi:MULTISPECIES: chlorophyll synthase ChlG [Marichromatium]|uniref:Chlorophyll synthase n=1 Tax=Marichromatium gracile TaxID=1048 RepID=A0A4R4AG91_MARGR|nr:MULTISPECIES: chlorophyll synthase ChlG [Marichromatium]MBO8084466.1 chlorophyll synthase ChlG [Marichromatium sp.]MBK1708280.1 bacteriochlorophyll/chlorophyll a synthase [Marichromatium gracile]RNE90797.1 chlorophyll synthase ChlG [Marichromatium sp. AB31]RNE94431.1 chlorophyll synthase ChlG [Marichromatium sp. AB32]TCW38258.1 chlorophyll synthase [Marichromatium gracile]